MPTEIDIDDIADEAPEVTEAPNAPVEEKEDIAPVEDVLNVLEPNAEPREVRLQYEGLERVYLQKPLAYFRKMEFFGLLGRTIDQAMEGEDGLRVNALFTAMPTSVSDVNDLDSFLALVAKIAAFAPDFLKECYVLWLDVPKKERAWAREALDNIDDDEGQAVIETFIDQNWEALESFFGDRVNRVARRIQARRKKD